MSVSITLNTDGPRDPQYTLEVAEALAESVRVLNHLTLDHASLEYPAEADALLRYLHTAVSRLPQLLGQVAAWLKQEQDAGRIRFAGTEFTGAEATVTVARIRLEAAGMVAGSLAEDLAAVTSVTSMLGAPEMREDDGDG